MQGDFVSHVSLNPFSCKCPEMKQDWDSETKSKVKETCWDKQKWNLVCQNEMAQFIIWDGNLVHF